MVVNSVRHGAAELPSSGGHPPAVPPAVALRAPVATRVLEVAHKFLLLGALNRDHRLARRQRRLYSSR